MSKHEAELRRRLSDGDDFYDTMSWFLSAIDAQACADGGPEPDLSWFEREFLEANIDRYYEEQLRRMTVPELLNAAAMERFDPSHRWIDMSGAADEELINKMVEGPHRESATEELVKRANGKCMTLADYIGDIARKS
jgi:hypothetical protein